MMTDNLQYTTVCPLCREQLPLSQKQVETGRAPICDGCGGTMIVHGAIRGRAKVRRQAQDKPRRNYHDTAVASATAAMNKT
jgi:hypothetical protein